MTLILKHDLDMVKMYHLTKNEVSMSRHSKVIAKTDTHTHTQYENITFPHTRAVKIRQRTIAFCKNSITYVLLVFELPLPNEPSLMVQINETGDTIWLFNRNQPPGQL